MNSIQHYAKSLTYVALAAVGFLVPALSDNTVDGSELLNLAVVVLGAIGVYLIPNLPDSAREYSKTAVAFLTAAVIAIISFLTDGITTAEWLQVGVAALAAIGVFIVPNAPEGPAPVAVEVTTSAAVVAEIAPVDPAQEDLAHGRDVA